MKKNFRTIITFIIIFFIIAPLWDYVPAIILALIYLFFYYLCISTYIRNKKFSKIIRISEAKKGKVAIKGRISSYNLAQSIFSDEEVIYEQYCEHNINGKILYKEIVSAKDIYIEDDSGQIYLDSKQAFLFAEKKKIRISPYTEKNSTIVNTDELWHLKSKPPLLKSVAYISYKWISKNTRSVLFDELTLIRKSSVSDEVKIIRLPTLSGEVERTREVAVHGKVKTINGRKTLKTSLYGVIKPLKKNTLKDNAIFNHYIREAMIYIFVLLLPFIILYLFPSFVAFLKSLILPFMSKYPFFESIIYKLNFTQLALLAFLILILSILCGAIVSISIGSISIVKKALKIYGINIILLIVFSTNIFLIFGLFKLNTEIMWLSLLLDCVLLPIFSVLYAIKKRYLFLYHQKNKSTYK